MDSFISTCDRWLQKTFSFKGEVYTCYINIYIHNSLFSQSYLVILDEYLQPQLCAPINSSIDINYSKNELEIKFNPNSNDILVLCFEDDSDLECFLAQYNMCLKIGNTEPNIFEKENESFINLKRNEQASKSPFLASSVQLPYSFPSDKDAKKTWRKNVEMVNYSMFSDLKYFKLGILTYNVAENAPNDCLISDLKHIFDNDVDYDALFITLQEIDSSTKAIVIGSTNVKDKWTNLFRNLFSTSKKSYALVESRSLGGLYVALFTKPLISNYFAVNFVETIRFGTGGYLANKSCIIINLRICDVNVSICGCHLTAHDIYLNERIAQIKSISKKIRDSDVSIIAGDLNFRVTKTYEEAVKACSEFNLQCLLDGEQLKCFSKSDTEFDYNEPEISFLPTYKFDIGTNVYDTSTKRRVPSYCDRILFRCGPPRFFIESHVNNYVFESDILINNTPNIKFSTESTYQRITKRPNYPSNDTVECIYYHSLGSTFSDHKPVLGIFRIKVPVIDAARYEKYLRLVKDKEDDYTKLSLAIHSLKE